MLQGLGAGLLVDFGPEGGSSLLASDLPWAVLSLAEPEPDAGAPAAITPWPKPFSSVSTWRIERLL